MAYSYISLAQMQTELANRLDDYNSVYWTRPELTLYIQESLRTWQALTGSWRNRMVFNTRIPSSPTNVWYDLAAQASSVIPFTLKDTDIISIIAYHLIEPQLLIGGLWAGSDQFILADIVQAIQRRRDQFLVETGMVTSLLVQGGIAPPISRVPLPDNVIDIRCAAWIDQNLNFTTLYKTDEWAAESYSSSWANSPANPPSGYAVAASPPVTLQIIPPPLGSGQVELIVVKAGAALNPATGVLLGIPDNFAHVVKWGALADLLGREGQPHDALLAGYCEQRWQEGIAAARIHSSVVTAYLNGVQVFPDSIHSLSSYRSGWQNQVGPPDTLALMSWNLAAIAPIDTNGPYSVQLDVVQNAPVPILPTDQVQIGREELDAILSNAQHLAAFKQQGQEFSESTALYRRMIDLAVVKNARLKSAVPFYDALASRATIQERESSRREPVEPQ